MANFDHHEPAQPFLPRLRVRWASWRPSLGWGRLLSLAAGVLGGFCLLAGLFLPWTVTVYRHRADFLTEPTFYGDAYPTACAAVSVIMAASLVLLCVGRARGLVTLINLVAAAVILCTLGATREMIAASNSRFYFTQYVVGFCWIVLIAGVDLNLLASVVQPEPD
jgi:hypothetical protein